MSVHYIIPYYDVYYMSDQSICICLLSRGKYGQPSQARLATFRIEGLNSQNRCLCSLQHENAL